MRHFGQTLKLLIKTSRMPLDMIAEGIGVGKGYIYKLQNKPTADTEMVSKICRYFKVSPLAFFDNDLMDFGLPSGDVNEYNNTAVLGHATMNIGMISDIQNLKAIIAEKERLIQILLNGKTPVKDVLP